LAVFKAIGYSDRFILFFVLAESLVIALIGAAFGLGLAMLFIPALGKSLNGMLPAIVLSPAVLAYGIALAILAGVLAGLLPGIGAMRLRVVNALRRV
jgi:putative ABC transport system permease protein